MSEPAADPQSGYALVVVRRDVATTLWWGDAAGGEDVVAVRGGRVMTWSSPEDCFAEVSAAGWSVTDDEPTRMDLTPALEWHGRQRRGLDAKAVLDSWNLAGDVARSTGTPWGDRGMIADACHTKLTTACVPWLAGLDAYAPRWTVTEERYLHRRLGAAFDLLSHQLTRRGGRCP